jgi:hypothetical protein
MDIEYEVAKSLKVVFNNSVCSLMQIARVCQVIQLR